MPKTDPIPDRSLSLPNKGRHSVPVAQTLQFNFGNDRAPTYLPSKSKVGTTPTQVRPSWSVRGQGRLEEGHEGGVTKYIYMEDPAFCSQEVMSWIHDRVRKDPNVRVILLTRKSGIRP